MVKTRYQRLALVPSAPSPTNQPDVTEETFTCSMCANTYSFERTDEEAKKEYEQEHGRPPGDTDEIVCDTCYLKLMAWKAQAETKQ